MVKKSSKKLTPGQLKVFNALMDFIEIEGYPPSTRDLAKSLGISAPSVHEQLKKLEDKHFIKRGKNKARSIEILKKPTLFSQENEEIKVKIPVLGKIAAGMPIFAVENHSGNIEIDSSLFGSGKFFALTVSGDSMIDCGINDGSYVIIRQQPIAEKGEIVAALLGEEATVKRLRVVSGKVLLCAENQLYTPIDVTTREDFRILGKVVTWGEY
jgi:repressor LexA